MPSIVDSTLIVSGLVAALSLACASETHTTVTDTTGDASDSTTSETTEASTSGTGTTDDMAPTTGDAGTTGSTGSTGATDDSGTTDDSGDLTSGGDAPTIPFACPGGAIGPGMSSIVVGDATRTLLADFPADPDQPMGVLFSWHGYGDTAVNFRAAAGLDPDGDPALPVVVITPEDSGLPPPIGLDWDLASGMPEDMNVDLALFEAVLGCLDAQYDIDPTRIYSFGFSAGGVMTNLLHSRYPKLVAAIVTASGAWFNDEAEADLVNIFDIMWKWPALDPADGGTVLLTHGGPSDVTILNILDLEASAQAAIPFLAASGRTVVDCAHTQGHTLHPEVTPGLISAFLSAHRAGQPSPYLSGGFDDFPPSCELRVP